MPILSGLYIHVPFCKSKCFYCHFASFPDQRKEIPRYLKALAKEMKIYKGKTLETLFIGGGTPTLLNPKDWTFLFQSLRNSFDLSPQIEITVECNPESVTEKKLSLFLENGVNRLSMGLQSSHEKLLNILGRCHTVEQFKRIYSKARTLGFKNVNIDLIYGIPEQTLSDWDETIVKVLNLSPEHISAYALSIEEETPFDSKKYIVDDELQAEMFELISERVQKAGYVHYEISNFAKQGFECRHNLRYWKNMETIGIGVSSASYENGIRRKNSEDLYHYLASIENGSSPVIEETTLSKEEQIGENLMLSLRLKEGFDITPEIRTLYGDVIDKYISLGFLKYSENGKRVVPTLEGWLFSDQIFRELLHPSSTVH